MKSAGSSDAPLRLEAEGSVGVIPAEPKGAYFYMDAMRTMFALVVAFGHAWALLIRDYQAPETFAVQAAYFISGFGHQAVILFFVLSGFWISRSVVRSTASGWSWRHYLTDRLTRLMPVLVATLALGGILDAIGLYVLRSPTYLGLTNTYVLRTDVAANLSWDVLLSNLVFLQIIVRPFGTNGPLWSLAYEFWFYIWFPALWLALRYRRPSIALATLAFGWFVPTLALAFLSWLCGAAVFGIAQRLAGRRQLSRGKAWTLLAAASALLAAALLATRFGADTWKDPALAIVFSAFLLSLIILNPSPVALVRPLAIYGARASFSLYATHFPVMAFAAALTIGARRLPPDAYGVTLVMIVLAASLVLAWLFAMQTEGRTGALRRFFARFEARDLAQSRRKEG
ncbi:acyltransferase family protein [Sphingomonas koreensis]|uniref:acyltransferase family protein n=1 Tax=Sphingomonas koreensis TaxID=93064 RepID=UPI00234E53CE|nr:acyltransferase [Sphingomonas koreensis]MDC7810916.1 acyltransferase [Sphingomonas koreensis]